MLKATEALRNTEFSKKQFFILNSAEDIFDYAIRKAAENGQLAIYVERYTINGRDTMSLRNSPNFPEDKEYKFEGINYNYADVLHALIDSLTLLYIFRKSMEENYGYETNVHVRREGNQKWATLTIAWGDAYEREKEKERGIALEAQRQELLRECAKLGGDISNLKEKAW